jgi:hypothetical protein
MHLCENRQCFRCVLGIAVRRNLRRDAGVQAGAFSVVFARGLLSGGL